MYFCLHSPYLHHFSPLNQSSSSSPPIHYGGWNQMPSLLPAVAWEALIAPLSYSTPTSLEGKASAAATSAAKSVFSYSFHMTPLLKTHTQPTTTNLLDSYNNPHAWTLETSRKAGAPSRYSVSSGSQPGNPGLTDKKVKTYRKREKRQRDGVDHSA